MLGIEHMNLYTFQQYFQEGLNSRDQEALVQQRRVSSPSSAHFLLHLSELCLEKERWGKKFSLVQACIQWKYAKCNNKQIYPHVQSSSSSAITLQLHHSFLFFFHHPFLQMNTTLFLHEYEYSLLSPSVGHSSKYHFPLPCHYLAYHGYKESCELSSSKQTPLDSHTQFFHILG